ncbi:MAG: hypothetical protein NTV46_05820, partial [Verrucomicrobia bacterium]|nr:hypothetical protein [Verrucomicrobiota bacterium]
FREIRRQAGAQDIRKYLANRFVSQRLDEVMREAPFHASAKLLHLQANGHRPTVVSRKVLAAELRSTLDQMNWILKIATIIETNWKVSYDASSKPFNVTEGYKINSADNAKMGDTYSVCRTRVDVLKRSYVEKKDLDLVERMLDVTNTLRDLHKGLRTIGPLNIEEVRKACRDLLSRHKKLNALLDSEIGEPQLPLNS